MARAVMPTCLEPVRGVAVVLPAFELLARQPDAPHVARVIVRYEAPDGRTYTMEEARNHKTWWLSASRGGYRSSATLRTTSLRKAGEWLGALEAGRVSVETLSEESIQRSSEREAKPFKWRRR